MVNVLHVFVLLMHCFVFTITENKGLPNYKQAVDYEVTDIKLLEETKCPQPHQCSVPLKYNIEYRCGSDVTCPRGNKCCIGNCFIHKVCVQPLHVQRLEILKSPTKNESSPLTTIFIDSTNITSLEEFEVKLSSKLMKILTLEAGKRNISAPGQLTHLLAIIPLLNISTLDKSESLFGESSTTTLRSDNLQNVKLSPSNFEIFKESIKRTAKEFNLNDKIIPSDTSSLKENLENNYNVGSEVEKISKKIEDIKNLIYRHQTLTQHYEVTERTLIQNNIFIDIDETYEDNKLVKEIFKDNITNHSKITNRNNKEDNSNNHMFSSVNVNKIKDSHGYALLDDNSEGSGYFEEAIHEIMKEYEGSGNTEIIDDEDFKYAEGSGDQLDEKTLFQFPVNKDFTHDLQPHKQQVYNYIESAIKNVWNKFYKKHVDDLIDDSDYFEGSGDEEGSGHYNYEKNNVNVQVGQLQPIIWKLLKKISDDSVNKTSKYTSTTSRSPFKEYTEGTVDGNRMSENKIYSDNITSTTTFVPIKEIQSIATLEGSDENTGKNEIINLTNQSTPFFGTTDVDTVSKEVEVETVENPIADFNNDYYYDSVEENATVSAIFVSFNETSKNSTDNINFDNTSSTVATNEDDLNVTFNGLENINVHTKKNVSANSTTYFVIDEVTKVPDSVKVEIIEKNITDLNNDYYYDYEEENTTASTILSENVETSKNNTDNNNFNTSSIFSSTKESNPNVTIDSPENNKEHSKKPAAENSTISFVIGGVNNVSDDVKTEITKTNFTDLNNDYYYDYEEENTTASTILSLNVESSKNSTHNMNFDNTSSTAVTKEGHINVTLDGSENIKDNSKKNSVENITSFAINEVSNISGGVKVEITKENITDLNNDYYYDVEEENSTQTINLLLSTFSSFTTVSPATSKESVEFIDIDNENITLIYEEVTTNTPLSNITLALEGSGDSEDEYDDSDGYYDYEGSGEFTTTYAEVTKPGQVKNKTATLKEYSSSIKSVILNSEFTNKHLFLRNKTDTAKESIFKTEFSEKEIQKESSTPFDRFKTYNEDISKKSEYSIDVRQAKAALDMMKASSVNEPDEYDDES